MFAYLYMLIRTLKIEIIYWRKSRRLKGMSELYPFVYDLKEEFETFVSLALRRTYDSNIEYLEDEFTKMDKAINELKTHAEIFKIFYRTLCA